MPIGDIQNHCWRNKGLKVYINLNLNVTALNGSFTIKVTFVKIIYLKYIYNVNHNRLHIFKDKNKNSISCLN